jgi:ABC-2 type transport system ATP-binding protein
MNGQIDSKCVSKKFGNKVVLKELSFVAKPSEITFLAGENGAGKTTWIRIALGLIRPTYGVIYFNGKVVNELRNLVSVVFDEPPVFPSLSGIENLHLISQSVHFDKTLADQLFDIFKFDKRFLKIKAKNYSLGQKHKLSIAAAILRKPMYMFLDEPSLGLDPTSWKMVSACLKEQAKRGSSIIVTGQDYRLMEKFVDKVIILKSGISIFQGSVSELNGIFESKICINLNADNDLMINMYSDKHMILKTGDHCYEIKCESDIVAQEIIKEIKRSEIEFSELYIKKNTLEESFQKMIYQNEVNNDANY